MCKLWFVRCNVQDEICKGQYVRGNVKKAMFWVQILRFNVEDVKMLWCQCRFRAQYYKLTIQNLNLLNISQKALLIFLGKSLKVQDIRNFSQIWKKLTFTDMLKVDIGS